MCRLSCCAKGFPGPDAQISKQSWYLTLTHYVDEQGRGIVPFTPAVQVYYAFEGPWTNCWRRGDEPLPQRYRRMATRIRERMAAWACSRFCGRGTVEYDYRLPSSGRPSYALHDQLKACGYVIYAGQGQLESKIFRVANMGALTESQIDGFLAHSKK